MKKSVITLFSALLLSSTVAISGHEAQAATNNHNSQATILINPGDLKITHANDVDFGNITLNGTKQTKSENSADIAISDFRGATTGWNLTVKKQDPSNNGFNNGIDLKFKPSSDDSTLSLAPEFTVNDSAQNFASVSNSNILDSGLTPSIKFNSTIEVGAKVRANSYKTTLVWNLSDTPQ